MKASAPPDDVDPRSAIGVGRAAARTYAALACHSERGGSGRHEVATRVEAAGMDQRRQQGGGGGGVCSSSGGGQYPLEYPLRQPSRLRVFRSIFAIHVCCASPGTPVKLHQPMQNTQAGMLIWDSGGSPDADDTDLSTYCTGMDMVYLRAREIRADMHAEDKAVQQSVAQPRRRRQRQRHAALVRT